MLGATQEFGDLVHAHPNAGRIQGLPKNLVVHHEIQHALLGCGFTPHCGVKRVPEFRLGTLPQALEGFLIFGKFDLIIVDLCHHNLARFVEIGLDAPHGEGQAEEGDDYPGNDALDFLAYGLKHVGRLVGPPCTGKVPARLAGIRS